MASTSNKISAEEKKWRADGDLHTLIEAEKIKADKPRYDAAMKLHAEMSDSLKKIKEG